MKKNGFTLTEMIAVLVIIGIILLITIPVMNNIIKDNREDKYKFYVETVEKALYSYGDIEMGMGSNATVSLSNLIERNYLKAFNEDGVTVDGNCEFTLNKNEYGKVTIVDEDNNVVEKIMLEFSDGKKCYKDSCM